MPISRWIDKEDMVYIPNALLLSNLKNIAMCSNWMDLENIILSKTEKDKYYNTYVELKKIMNL